MHSVVELIQESTPPIGAVVCLVADADVRWRICAAAAKSHADSAHPERLIVACWSDDGAEDGASSVGKGATAAAVPSAAPPLTRRRGEEGGGGASGGDYEGSGDSNVVSIDLSVDCVRPAHESR